MNKNIKKQFYEFNRRDHSGIFFKKPVLTKWFEASLDRAIQRGDISANTDVQAAQLVQGIADYGKQHNISTAVVGISGGIDSAVTASLFKAAGWTVVGVLMPIKQNPLETCRGQELVQSLGIQHRIHDLTKMYQNVAGCFKQECVDPGIELFSRPELIRQGNIRARLRMITLYNIAAQLGGLVASTDNFSELAAGFWTLHGDVGDLAPVQSLTKSWEIPSLAKHLAVPDSIIKAVPTDGLGISAGDEAQFGFSYAQLDLVLLDQLAGDLQKHISEADASEYTTIINIQQKIKSTAYKRSNPANLPHPISGNWRYQQLAQTDNHWYKTDLTNTPEV
jgi:NAD+ synthetase